MNFPKSLDRAVDVFNLRGGWVTVFLSVAGALLFVAFIVGFLAGGGVGFCFFLLGAVVDYFGCLFIQQTVSHRNLRKMFTKEVRLSVDKRETLMVVLRSTEGRKMKRLCSLEPKVEN